MVPAALIKILVPLDKNVRAPPTQSGRPEVTWPGQLVVAGLAAIV